MFLGRSLGLDIYILIIYYIILKGFMFKKRLRYPLNRHDRYYLSYKNNVEIKFMIAIKIILIMNYDHKLA